MIEINHLVGQIKRRYPHPEVRKEWVTDVVAALQHEQQPVTPQSLIEEYTYSDLSLSAYPSFPSNREGQTTLFVNPTLVQITFLTEIGSSAITLQNTMDQRKDVLSGRTRIRGLDDPERGNNDGIETVEDLGKLPEYSRGMMKVLVSDGASEIEGLEYRRISGLKLGETKLGCKLLLHNVKISRGILLLTPQNTQVIGGQIPHLEEHQPSKFIASLKNRIESAKNAPTGPPGKSKPTVRAKKAPVKTTKKESLSTPQSRLSYQPPVQPSTVVTQRNTGRPSLPISVVDTDEEETRDRARKARAAAILASTSPYFPVKVSGPSKLSETHKSNALPTHSKPSRSKREREEISEDEYGMSDDPDESFLRQVEMVEMAATQGQNHAERSIPPEAAGHDTDEFEDEVWEDDSFIRHFDQAQQGYSSSHVRRADDSHLKKSVSQPYIGNAKDYEIGDDGGSDEYDDDFMDDFNDFTDFDGQTGAEDDSIVLLPSAPQPRRDYGQRSSGIGGGRSTMDVEPRSSGRSGWSGKSVVSEVIEISD